MFGGVKIALDRALTRLRSDPGPESMAAVARYSVDGTDEQLAELTRVLADSGSKLTSPGGAVDIASTGGPGSLSTLLAPLYARALGAKIVKIAVPGRPAGGLDVLGTLPGFRAFQEPADAAATLDRCGYLHTGAGTSFCPLDATFFNWRQEKGAQAIANLAIASLLAKKVAAGIARVVLDVRVGPHGNLGGTHAEARANARQFISVAALLGIDAICVLSGSVWPPQPWIGRGEALIALEDVMTGSAASQLANHALHCFEMAMLAVGEPNTDIADVSRGVRAVHDAMLEAHGTTASSYQSRVEIVAGSSRAYVLAPHAGVLTIDVAELRSQLVSRQRASAPIADATFSDPSGLQMLSAEGMTVAAGDPLAKVRDQVDPAGLAEAVARCMPVVDSRDADLIPPREVIRA